MFYAKCNIPEINGDVMLIISIFIGTSQGYIGKKAIDVA
jgi:hypothetical protein